jgi:hypothetical protein
MCATLKGLSNEILMVALSLLALSASSSAHQVSSVSLITHLDTEGRTYLLDAAMAVIPSQDQARNDQISPEEAARLFAEEYLSVLFDEEEQNPELEIERINTSDEETPQELQQQEVLVKMTGSIPQGAKEYLLYLDPSSPMAVVMVAIKDQKPERRMQVILAGEYSRPINVQPVIEDDPFEAFSQEKGEAEVLGARLGKARHQREERGAFVSGWIDLFDGPLSLVLLPGVLLLLTLKGWPTVIQLAAVLVGQNTVISLVALDLISPIPSAGPILGGLLAVLACEIFFNRKLRWWRIVLLTVAGVMAGLIVTQRSDFYRLFVEPEQVEFGQVILYVTGAELAVVLIALFSALLLLTLRRFEWYEKFVSQPLAALVGACGIFELIKNLF